MSEQQSRGWLPNVIGVSALLLAVDTARQLVNAPPQYTHTVVFGYEVSGWNGYIASVVLMLFYAWVSAAAFRRRAMTVRAVIGYCIYLIISIWVWLSEYAAQGLQTKLITGALASVLLLVLCRIVLERREQFDRG